MECMEIALEILSNRGITSSLSVNPTLTELILISSKYKILQFILLQLYVTLS